MAQRDDRTGPEGKRTLVHFWLEYQGHMLELREGALVVGRSTGCHIVLDDALVSRRHGQFLVSEQTAMVEDFSSANGVYVNERRIYGRQALRDADRIQIGTQNFVLHGSTIATPAPFSRSATTAETLHRLPVASERSPADADPHPHEELTRRTEAIDLLCGVADKILALGGGDEAERILGAALSGALTAAKSARGLESSSAARAATYAVRIAEATSRPHYIDYAFELYGVLGRPLPGEVVEHLHVVLRKVNGVGLVGFRRYLARVRAVAPTLSPAERFVLQRLEGLERLILR